MKRLVLFPELYTTFEKQQQFGLLVRNMIQYVRFIERGELDELYVLTYGVNDASTLRDLQQKGTFPRGFHVLEPPRWLSSRIGQIAYSVIGPLIHRTEIAKADVFRTQQVTGSWTAMIAKLLYRKPLLFRLGYPLSVRFATEGKSLNRAIARIVESILVRYADHVAVTSRIMQRYYSAMGKDATVTVLPNYVDLSLASPIADYDRNKPVLFVGRLEDVKNIENIIVACSRMKVPLHLYYGGGELEDRLRKLAVSLGSEVVFKGSVPNEELMKIHHRHSVFMLCSLREGMPKAMIEAMASGLICVGTNTDGVSELIEHGKTGYLAEGFDADSITQALGQALEEMNPQIGRNARDFVVRNHSLEHAISDELAILNRITTPDWAGRTGSAAPLQASQSVDQPSN